jgi:hypothetical protein
LTFKKNKCLVNSKNKIIMEKKQTAVEFLGLELNMIFHDITPELWEEVELKFQQAKQMEKEQILDSWDDGYSCGMYQEGLGIDYYNETYGGKDEK